METHPLVKSDTIFLLVFETAALAAISITGLVKSGEKLARREAVRLARLSGSLVWVAEPGEIFLLLGTPGMMNECRLVKVLHNGRVGFIHLNLGYGFISLNRAAYEIMAAARTEDFTRSV